jgi:hypothetical protein
VTVSTEPDRILYEVLDELSSLEERKRSELHLHSEQVQRLRPLLAYAWRLHGRAGRTADGEAALKRFAYDYLSGQIPSFESAGPR